MSQVSVPLLSEIDALRKQLRATLALTPEAAIAARPPSGKWSVLENVRHLLFAEQAHMARVLRERPAWSPLGYTPETMRLARKLPSVATDEPTLAEVWAEWDRVHRNIARRLRNMPNADIEAALTRNLRHLRSHTALIERLSREAMRSAGSEQGFARRGTVRSPHG